MLFFVIAEVSYLVTLKLFCLWISSSLSSYKTKYKQYLDDACTHKFSDLPPFLSSLQPFVVNNLITLFLLQTNNRIPTHKFISFKLQKKHDRKFALHKIAFYKYYRNNFVILQRTLNVIKTSHGFCLYLEHCALCFWHKISYSEYAITQKSRL